MWQVEEFRARTSGGVLPNTSVKIEVPRSRNRREGTNDGRRSTLLAFPLECGSGNDVSPFREEIRYKQFVLMWRKAARAVVKEIIAWWSRAGLTVIILHDEVPLTKRLGSKLAGILIAL